MKHVAAVLLLLALAGCGTDDDTLHVLAAASLSDAFTELGERFEAEHEGVEVELSFGSSATLAEQAADGAPGGVLAAAHPDAMAIATDAGVAAEPITFAANVLVIVTPPGNPAGVASLADLAGTTWVRCADEVPCGRVALAVLADHGITAEPASLEEDVRATLDKVVAGEADAALVYATDAAAAGDEVAAIAIPGAERERNSYLIATLEQSADSALAQEFVDFVTGPDGRAVLAEEGFEGP